jgi:DNA-binding protein HU-beta
LPLAAGNTWSWAALPDRSHRNLIFKSEGRDDMSKKDLIDAVASHAELTKEKAGHAVEAVLAHIKSSMKKGDEVRIPDFGTFKVAKRKARTGRNPATGAEIKIPAAKVPKFTPSKGLKELLN